MQLPAGIRADRFADAQLEAGDAVMTRLYAYVRCHLVLPFLNLIMISNNFFSKVKDDGGRIDEQMEKNTGAQVRLQPFDPFELDTIHC